MQYLTYEEYSTYGGEMTEIDFNRFSFKSEQEINRRTFNRLKTLETIPEEVKRCVFELTEFYGKSKDEGLISSESQSVGNISKSVSYASTSTADYKQQQADIIRTYLESLEIDGIGVLYRGL